MLDNEARKKERDRLIRLYYEKDKEFESAKGKRTIISILFFSLVYLIILFSFDYAIIYSSTGEGIHLKDIVSNFMFFVPMLVYSLIFGVIHFFANAAIFSQLSQMGRNENEHLKYIEKRIRELEKGDPN